MDTYCADKSIVKEESAAYKRNDNDIITLSELKNDFIEIASPTFIYHLNFNGFDKIKYKI